MADDAKTASEPGAPIAKDAIDHELVDLKLPRKRMKIGMVTALGIAFLAAFFLLKLNPDRRFAGSGDSPAAVSAQDIAGGKVDTEKLVTVKGELMLAHAILASNDKKSLGLRVVPLRGGDHKVWVVLDADGYGKPTMGVYTGRLRDLNDLPFGDTIRSFIANHPQPLFANAAAVRAGFASNKVAMVGGEQADVRDSDHVAFDVVDPNAATVVCTFNEHHETADACVKALTDAGITPQGAPRPGREQAYFDIGAMPQAVETLKSKLDAAKLFGARVDPVTRHFDTTWGKLKASGPAGFTVDTTTLPDAQLDLIGLYVVRAVPSQAYAVILDEHPQDYWYVLPVTVIVGLIFLIFAWAFVRAVKRDLIEPAKQRSAAPAKASA